METNPDLSIKIEKIHKRVDRFEAELSQTLDRRLVIGLITFASWIAAAVFRDFWIIQVLAFLFGPAVFFFFVKKSSNLRRHLNSLKSWLEFLKRQQMRQRGETPKVTLPDTTDFDSGLINDFDLFQRHSLFSFLDETFTFGGRSRLASRMLENTTSAEKIQQNQNMIKALSEHIWPLSRIRIAGDLESEPKMNDSAKNPLRDFVERPFLEPSFARDYKILLLLFALTLIALLANFAVPNKIWTYFLMAHAFYFLISSAKLKEGFGRANDIANQMARMNPIFSVIEKTNWHGPAKEVVRETLSLSPSKRLKELNWIVSCLSVQAHALVFIGLNCVLPWSFFFTSLLDRKRKYLREQLPPCLDELCELEALSSLAFLTHYQTSVFPSTSDKHEIRADQIFHPLIERNSVVKNSLTLSQPTVALITGSNMAGKSTFLRTVGVNHILMQMGAPIFGNSYVAFPFSLASSIRVSDSLADGFSYFYAEVLRLKEITDKCKANSGTLFLIDEIFRGTNNRERLIGSQSILRALVGSESMGFVSTHDLELTKLADESSRISNYHFRDDVVDSKLQFSYLIQNGPCPTTNALKIMEDAGLPIDASAETS